MKKNLFSLFSIIIYASSFCFSQDVSGILKKVSDAYINSPVYSADVIVNGFTSKSDKVGSLIGTGMIRKSNSNYYSKFLTDEMVANKSCVLLIDYNDKTITYFDSVSDKYKAKKFSLADIDTLLYLNDSTVYKGVTNGLIKISVYNSKSAITQADIYIDEKTDFIEKLIYYYKEANTEESNDIYKIVIEYKNITTTVSDMSVFSESKFVTITNKKPVLTYIYKNYSLVVTHYEAP